MESSFAKAMFVSLKEFSVSFAISAVLASVESTSPETKVL